MNMPVSTAPSSNRLDRRAGTAAARIDRPALPAAGEPAQVAHAAALLADAETACRRIAPSWPLDRFIAVNPWWGFVDRPMQEAASHIARLCGAAPTMPLAWYLAQRSAGRITDAALHEALQRRGPATDPGAFEAACRVRVLAATPAQSCLPLFTDHLDAQPADGHRPACRELVIHAIGQHCAAWFDRGQARWKATPETGLYAAWRRIAAHDHGASRLSGIAGIAARIAALPDAPQSLIEQACGALQIKPAEARDYFTALLLSVNGWAGWCAYLRHQAAQACSPAAGTPPADDLMQLLAIRLAWEWVLADCAGEALRQGWIAARRMPGPAADEATRWVWQEALEIGWQRQVGRGLASGAAARFDPFIAASTGMRRTDATRPALQAVFCIDVRSEPMRRALEAGDPGIRTLGFAGFFGMPIDYLPFGAQAPRPQLPGLLAPKLRVQSQAATPLLSASMLARRRARLGLARAWEGLRTSAAGGFGVVETTGLAHAWQLLRESLGGIGQASSAGSAAGRDPDGLRAAERAQLHPVLEPRPVNELSALAAGILRAMSIGSDFAPLVLLIGHGSTNANNPHAAGLDCGACCGQSGEVNARALADLLNRDEVRSGLLAHAIAVPADTRFVAGLHDTTTDDIRLFAGAPDGGGSSVAPGPAAEAEADAEARREAHLARARERLSQASRRARAARAPALGLAGLAAQPLEAALRRRAADWSEVRPEWGLANNAGFIAAPRSRTRHLDLDGRSFLHEYDPAQDADGSVLESILTAPVIVAHWINLQYYASTVDNCRWGSGNKVLHNVVGANIGVFEGNGGDLRIGLPLQSLHDGSAWRHQPLRLSVWLEASTETVDRIVAKHAILQQLVEGAWLHLFCIAPGGGTISRRAPDGAWHGETAPA